MKKSEILRVSLEYTKETLKSNEIQEDVAEEIERKKNVVKKLLKESDGDFCVNKEIFEKVVNKFKSSRKRNYDFIVKSDPKFQEMVFRLCKVMIENEKFPTEFQNTTLHMIYKGKGRKEDLSKNRFIHSKPWFPRLV